MNELQVGDIIYISDLPAYFGYLLEVEFEVIELLGKRVKIRSLEPVLDHYQIVTIPVRFLTKIT